MNLASASPLELTEDILGANILGYSVLQIGVAAAVIGGGIYGLRLLYQKALNG